MTDAALRGKPDAGNPHVRFDEGEVAPAATPRRGSLLYKTTTIIAAAAFSVLATAYAEDIAWTGGDDGTTLNKGENWSGDAAPGATDKAKFETNGTLNLTANADFSAGSASFAPKDGPLTVNLDLDGHTWEGNAPASKWLYRFVVNGTETYPIVFNFTDGLITNMTDMTVGLKRDGYAGRSYNTTVNISGSGTKVVAYADDLVVGDGTNNVLEVSNGAFVRSGRALVVGSSASATGNLVRVTGAGTTFVQRPAGDYSKIGRNASENKVIVDDGALFRQESALNCITAVGDGATAAGNRFDVSGGAVADFNVGNLYVGSMGADGNVFTASNATVSVTGIYVGRDPAKDTQDGACRNAMYFGDGASLVVSNHISVGEGKFANSNLVVFAGAGTTARTENFDVTVGKYGVGNQMFVKDGASLFVRPYETLQRDLYVGGTATVGDDPARDSLLEISGENSRLDVSRDAYVGLVGATNNALVVKDGAFAKIVSDLKIGSHADSVSNSLTVLGAELMVSNRVFVGFSSGSSFNRVEYTHGARVLQVCGFQLGGAAGANSNLFVIADGAVVTNNVHASWDCREFVGNHDEAVGNRMVISNATFCSPLGRSEFVANYKGRGNVIEALGGAKVFVNQSFHCGVDAKSCYGLLRAAGEGTVLSNMRYHVYIDGHHNGISIEDGAKMYVQNQIRFGNDTTGSNNWFRIANGEFHRANGSQPMYMYNKGRLIWEGSRSVMANVSTLNMQGDSELELVADEDGLAPFGPMYETYMLNNDWSPSVAKITVDARKYLENNKSGTFTILKSDNNRTMRTLGGTNLSAQSAETQEAVTQAFRERIKFIPEGCGEISEIDLAKSKIVVKVKKREGFILMVW